MNAKKMSLYFLGGVPIQYFRLDPIDPRSSLDTYLYVFAFKETLNTMGIIDIFGVLSTTGIKDEFVRL